MNPILLIMPGIIALGAAASAMAQTPPLKPPEKPAKLEHMQKAQAESILGESVVDAAGQPMGRIVDVLINAQGTPHAAVIEFGGFLGVGNRDIAVVWKALHFAVVKNEIVISLDVDATKLKAMPTYKAEAKTVAVAVPAKPAATPPAVKPQAVEPKAEPQKAGPQKAGPQAAGLGSDHQGTPSPSPAP